MSYSRTFLSFFLNFRALLSHLLAASFMKQISKSQLVFCVSSPMPSISTANNLHNLPTRDTHRFPDLHGPDVPLDVRRASEKFTSKKQVLNDLVLLLSKCLTSSQIYCYCVTRKCRPTRSTLWLEARLEHQKHTRSSAALLVSLLSSRRRCRGLCSPAPPPPAFPPQKFLGLQLRLSHQHASSLFRSHGWQSHAFSNCDGFVDRHEKQTAE